MGRRCARAFRSSFYPAASGDIASDLRMSGTSRTLRSSFLVRSSFSFFASLPSLAVPGAVELREEAPSTISGPTAETLLGGDMND